MSQSNAPLLDGATRDLASFAANLTFEQIPAVVVDRIKTSVLDSIGCCLFGATLPWTQKVQAMVEEEGSLPVASLLGTGKKTSVAGAVLVNATAGHAFELDDIHKESIVHAGSIALPVAIALAEKTGRRHGRDLITAMVAGYEIGTRVGNAATMSLFFRGFHPQGTSGAFVAAATAGRMLGLDAKRMQHALGIVGSQAGGLMAHRRARWSSVSILAAPRRAVSMQRSLPGKTLPAFWTCSRRPTAVTSVHTPTNLMRSV